MSEASKSTQLSISPSDEELVKNAKKGDTLAFEQLVQRYEGKIYNLIYRMVEDKTVAKDILQETFIKVYRSLPAFRENSKFSTWLYRIAINFCLMHARKKKKKTFSFDELIQTEEDEIPKDIPDWSSNPEATLQNKELKKKLENAISSLPDKYKSVLILRDIDGLSNKEVSKILNITVPAVKSRVHRAREFLREQLSEYFSRN